MVVILFPVGAFGSTMEYALRNFSNELQSIEARVLDTGSMHSYKKEFHPTTIDGLGQIKNWTIATPVYTGHDYLDPVTTVQKITEKISAEQKLILIHFDTPEQVYRNSLFAYYKAPGHVDRILKNKPKLWNPAYTCVSDMQIYELREALSFVLDNTDNYLQIPALAQDNWLCVTADDILYNFKHTVITMLDYCNLTLNSPGDIDNFYLEWFEKQKYIVDEFQTIQKILKSLESQSCEWSPLSIMGEAIVQYCLRTQGIEIACHNLNQFPTSTEELKRSMIKGTS
jgi:hypothetical protein